MRNTQIILMYYLYICKLSEINKIVTDFLKQPGATHYQGIEEDVKANPYITIVVLVAGVAGGLAVVISVIIFCKYCISNKNVLKR